jgi:cell division ATPase FtsA
MHLRLEEVFSLIARELDEAGHLDILREGVFICGGGARIPEIATLAARVFNLPASVAGSSELGGSRSTLDQPEFVAGIGLARFGHLELRKKARQKAGLADGIKNIVSIFPLMQRFRRQSI